MKCTQAAKTFTWHGSTRLGIRSCLSLVILWSFLGGCARVPVGCRHVSGPVQPRLQIYVAPATPVLPSLQKTLLFPLHLDQDKAQGAQGPLWQLALSQLLQDVLLQHQAFTVVELADSWYEPREQALKTAIRRGFDFVIIGEVPVLMQPTDVSPGRIALRLKVLSTANRATIWSLYAEADLCPEPGRDLIVWEKPHRPAPSLSQGFAALACVVSDALQEGAFREAR